MWLIPYFMAAFDGETTKDLFTIAFFLALGSLAGCALMSCWSGFFGVERYLELLVFSIDGVDGE